MNCPCCQNEMFLAHTHAIGRGPNIEARTYKVYICQLGGHHCNGLIAKYDVLDQKVNFVTPGHTTTTLHVNYIKSLRDDNLLKAIFSAFEWCDYKGL